MTINLVLLDVDGTLTVDRGNLALDPDAIKVIQRVKDKVKLGLVTGNALIVAETLTRYIGLGDDSPIIAENGCVIKVGSTITMLSNLSAREVVDELIKRLGLRPTYQYQCRYLDITIDVVGDDYGVVERIKDELRRMRLSDLYDVETSGYAVHVRPRDCSKAKAIAKMCALSFLLILNMSVRAHACPQRAASRLGLCPPHGSADPLRCPQALRGGSKLGHMMVQLTVAPGWGRPSGTLGQGCVRGLSSPPERP